MPPPSPFPPPPPALSLAEHVQALNARYSHGHPSNILASAGLLVRQFDALDDGLEGRPWLPCPTEGWANWCAKFHRIWATSLVFKGGATQLYMPWGGGVILSPAVTINCAYPAE